MDDHAPDEGMTPQEQVDAARRAMSERQAAVFEQPSGTVPRVGIAILVAMVLPVSFSLLFSGAASSRGEVVPALLGFGGDEPTNPTLLWVARAGFAVIILTGIWLGRWRAREYRRFEHRERGFGEL